MRCFRVPFRRVLDREGWDELIQGIAILVASVVAAWFTSQYLGVVVAAVVFIIGLDIACRFFDYALIGSVYRQRNGRLRELYQEKKQYLDERFKTLYREEFVSAEAPAAENSFSEFLVEQVKRAKETACAPVHVVFSAASVFKVPRKTILKFGKSDNNVGACDNLCVSSGARYEGCCNCESFDFNDMTAGGSGENICVCPERSDKTLPTEQMCEHYKTVDY